MSKRNPQIDALRLLAMFLICMTHVLGHGGISGGVSSNNGYAVHLLSCIASCGIDLFGLLSGYLLGERYIEYKKLQKTWIQIFLYSAGLQLFAVLAWKHPLSQSIPFLFPILTGIYWYCSAYFLLFFALPVLNGAIAQVTQIKLTTAIIIIFIVLSLYRLVPFFHHGYLQKLNLGISPIFLGYLYIIGAYLKKYGISLHLSLFREMMCIVLFIWISWLPYCVRAILPITRFRTDFPQMLNGYISPTILLSSVLLFHFMLRLRLPRCLEGVLGACGQSAFGVYLIHDHPAIRQHFIMNRFAFVQEFSFWSVIPATLGFSFAVFTVCLIADIIMCSLTSIVRASITLKQ